MIKFVNTPFKLETTVTDELGVFITSIVVNYEIIKSSDESAISSGIMEVEGNVYAKELTLTAIGQYRVLYLLPEGYTSGSEIIEVINKEDFKADISELALEETVQLVKIETDKIPQLIIDVELIKQIESGKWQLVGNQLIFYKDDNITEICRFNTFDVNGTPSMEDIMKRERV